MNEKKYNAHQDYCEAAAKCQSVPSNSQYALQHPKINPKDYNANRAGTLYSCPDDYKMGSIQDNQIYIATTDAQHDQIVNGQHIDNLSGCFSDQATIDACKENGTLDNTKYNEMCQIAPYRENGIDGKGDVKYKPHVDCFDINRQTLKDNYGTSDFNAAIGKCMANNQFGAGGGNQGFNPYINEMLENGSLKHNPKNSYSDSSISESKYCNENPLTNSIVNENDYKDMMHNAQLRAQDCVENNTPHPSPQACNNGFTPNKNPIASEPGNAIPCETENKQKGKTPMQEEAANADKIAATPQGKEEEKPTIKQVADENNLLSKEPVKDNNLAQNQSSEPIGEKPTMNQVANENSLPKTEPKLDNSLGQNQNITQ